jgi:hypothetical protein
VERFFTNYFWFHKYKPKTKTGMAKYLITYHGAQMPNDPKMMEMAKAAFGQWLQQAGNAVVDPGAPTRMIKQVSNGGSSPVAEIGGYSIIEAGSDEEVSNILKTHPFISRGGTLQVNQLMTV